MHASADVLELYLLGDLPPAEVNTVHAHLSSCDVCQQTLCGLEAQHDTVVLQLRQGKPPDPFEAERSCQEMLSQLANFKETSVGASRSQTAGDIDLPKMIRDYRLLESLGSGGMGTVYRALHTKLDRVVAVKLLSPEKMSVAAATRFEREMQIIGKLDHPHIVHATDAGVTDGKPFLVMELLDGLDLDGLVREEGPLDVSLACAMVRQAALGLQYAFEQGVVHRDIKPSNLMLTRLPGDGWQVKVLDLGLALFDQPPVAAGELTTDGQLMGTIDYMAPEQGANTHRVDIRADIYSLGATLFRLIAGVAPLADPQRDSVMKKLTALATVEPPDIRTLRPDVPAPLAALLRRLLAKRPEDRPNRPIEVAVLLAPFAAGCELATLPANPITKRPVLRRVDIRQLALSASQRRERWRIAAAGLAFVVMLAVLVFQFTTRDGVITVQLDTPQSIASIKVDGHVVKWTQGDDPQQFRFEVKPGAVSSIVLRAEDGTEIHTAIPNKRLTISAGKSYTLTASTQPLIEPPDSPVDHDRLVAEWAHALGGQMGLRKVRVRGYHWIPAKDELPREPFVILDLDLGRKRIQDRDLVRIDGLSDCSSLSLARTEITDAGIATLGKLPQLKSLYLDGTKLTDAALSTLPVKYPQIRVFEARKTQITDAGIPALRSWTQLAELGLEDLPLTDKALESLTELKALRKLALGSTRVTRAGVERLHAALPACRIDSDYGVFEYSEPGDYALEFHFPALVTVPTLKYDGGPLTVEMTIRPSSAAHHSLAIIGTSRVLFWRDEDWQGVNLDFDGHTLTAGVKEPPALDRTVQVACTFDGKSLLYFIDGKVLAKGVVVPQETTRPAGGYFGGYADPSYRGRMDELRVSKVTRYSDDYVPQLRFEPDSDTIALYHFDEGHGNELKDSSGNDHHGTIRGAVWVKNDP